MAKGGLEMREKDQEGLVLDLDGLAVAVEAGAGDQAMDVGMREEPLVPGVENGDEARDVGFEVFVGGEFLAQGRGNGGEEMVEGFLGLGAEEKGPELGREGEGHKKIGSFDAFAQLALHPGAGGSAPTLGTGFVVAGMKGEVVLTTALTGKDLSAQSRGAATGDGTDGVALRSRKAGMGLEEIRQELAQRPDDRGRAGHGE